VLVIESKPEKSVKSKWDIFEVVHTEPADEKVLRTCQELGHKA
jgi:branched-chain amino acid transport system substrate-binding protein